MVCNRCVQMLIIALISSCSSINVITHETPNIDFSKFQTFKTVNDLERPGNTDAYNEYIELDRAIAGKMEERKYREVQDADLGVHYRIIVQNKTELNINRDRYYRYSMMNESLVQKYTEGILLIEIRDRSNRKVVWQASLDLRINRRKKLEEIIDDTVNYIFAEYPYEAGSNTTIRFPRKSKGKG